MSHSWHDIRPGEHLPKEFDPVVEIPLAPTSSMVRRVPGRARRLRTSVTWLDRDVVIEAAAGSANVAAGPALTPSKGNAT